MTNIYSANDVLALEIPAGGTDFSAATASPESQAAYEKLWEADLWMIYRNVKTNVLHFDFVSVLPLCVMLSNLTLFSERAEPFHYFPCGG